MFKTDQFNTWASLVGVIVFLLSPRAMAEVDYPELSIVPRYSDRLAMEAKTEPLKKWGVVATLSVPFAASVGVGCALFNPDIALAHWVPFSVGTVGLVSMGIFGALFHPYAQASAEVSELKNGTLRERLYHERIAQERIESLARMGNRLRFFIAGTNLIANIYTLASYASLDSAFYTTIQKNTGVVVAGLGAVLALTPVFFAPYWSDVADEQEDYRKRIFSPVASATVFSVGGQAVPGILLSARF